MTTETEDKLERARSQARGQLASIVAMVKRLEHSRECDGGEDCELPPIEIMGGLGYVGLKPDDDERNEYHDDAAAELAIQEDALSVETRSEWHTPGDAENAGDAEYRVCLCTGGPAVQIIGELGAFGPDTARLQCQDWFTPWTDVDTTSEDDEALLAYAQQLGIA